MVETVAVGMEGAGRAVVSPEGKGAAARGGARRAVEVVGVARAAAKAVERMGSSRP